MLELRPTISGSKTIRHYKLHTDKGNNQTLDPSHGSGKMGLDQLVQSNNLKRLLS